MFIIYWSDVLSGECSNGIEDELYSTKEAAISSILEEIESNYKEHLGEDYDPEDYRNQLEKKDSVYFEILYADSPNKYSWKIKSVTPQEVVINGSH